MQMTINIGADHKKTLDAILKSSELKLEVSEQLIDAMNLAKRTKKEYTLSLSVTIKESK